jgi:hyperosmotically inducible protein
MRNKLGVACFAAMVCGAALLRADDPTLSEKGINRLKKEVRHELLMLPYYGVFDNLTYTVGSTGTITLQGQVTRPTLKSGAERAVKEVEGVSRVANNIEVLPLSPQDDNLRISLYRAIYGSAQLNRYALQAVPSIHIIVKNGQATLEGVAANEADKIVAGIQANGVSGVFSVVNNLLLEAK